MGRPASHQSWWPGSSDGDTPNGFGLCLSPGPGFSDKQVLTQSCVSLPCLLCLCPCQPCCSRSVGLCCLHLLLVQPVLPAGMANTFPQWGKLATSETNLTRCRNICLFTCIYTSGPSDLQAPSHESSQQMLEHVVSQEGHFLHWLSSGKGNLQGRTSSLSFESHQEQERATSVCSETCLESELGQHAASLGAKQDAREQKETKYQTFSRRLCYINTSLWSGAHPGSWVNTPGQHYSIPVTLKPGEKLTICYCT